MVVLNRIIEMVMEKVKIEFAENIEGYYWMADSDTPVVVHSRGDWPWRFSDDLPMERNYVVAAFLCEFDGEKPVRSIHIRFVDGEYKCDAVTLPDDHDEPQVFIGEKGLQNLRFLQLWDEVPSEYDKELVALLPGKSLFVGFEK